MCLIMETYEKLLEEAYGKIKKTEGNGERFEIPKVEGHFEGKKTIITNFSQLASVFRRNPEHLQKFLLKELAAAGQKEGDRLVLNIKVPSAKINQKIGEYAREFVICRECGKPDTKVEKEGNLSFIKCMACGARHSIKSKI